MSVVKLPVQRQADDEWAELQERAFAGIDARDRSLRDHDEQIRGLTETVTEMRTELGRVKAELARLRLSSPT
jgi:hypothetical protein